MRKTKCYKDSRRNGTTYIQQKERRLTVLVAFAKELSYKRKKGRRKRRKKREKT
jgi:hypothetical protein